MDLFQPTLFFALWLIGLLFFFFSFPAVCLVKCVWVSSSFLPHSHHQSSWWVFIWSTSSCEAICSKHLFSGKHFSAWIVKVLHLFLPGAQGFHCPGSTVPSISQPRYSYFKRMVQIWGIGFFVVVAEDFTFIYFPVLFYYFIFYGFFFPFLGFLTIFLDLVGRVFLFPFFLCCLFCREKVFNFCEVIFV